MFRADHLKSQGVVVSVILIKKRTVSKSTLYACGETISWIFYGWLLYLNRFKKPFYDTAVLSTDLDALTVIEP